MHIRASEKLKLGNLINFSLLFSQTYFSLDALFMYHLFASSIILWNTWGNDVLNPTHIFLLKLSEICILGSHGIGAL